jgi:hypothetical protein
MSMDFSWKRLMDQDGCSLEGESRNLEKTWKNSDAGLILLVWLILIISPFQYFNYFALFYIYLSPPSHSYSTSTQQL